MQTWNSAAFVGNVTYWLKCINATSIVCINLCQLNDFASKIKSIQLSVSILLPTGISYYMRVHLGHPQALRCLLWAMLGGHVPAWSYRFAICPSSLASTTKSLFERDSEKPISWKGMHTSTTLNEISDWWRTTTVVTAYLYLDLPILDVFQNSKDPQGKLLLLAWCKMKPGYCSWLNKS